jgi:predicted lipoprotein
VTAKPALLALTLAAVLAAPSAAAAEPDYARINGAAIEGRIVPGYALFADAAAKLDESVRGLCEAPSEATLEAARAAFHDAMDAWMGVQFIRFGPIEQDNRVFRIQYWPEQKNAIGRQLAALLAVAGKSPPTAESLAEQSVAVQGLPALERLLFGDRAAAAESPAACAVAAAASGNVDAMAAAVSREWQDEFARVIEQPGPDNALYRSQQEVTRDLFKTLIGCLEAIARLKLGPVLGAATGEAHPKRAESWRRARSLRNIALNLAALRALYEGTDDHGFAAAARAQPGGEEVARSIEDGFAQSFAAAGRVTVPLAEAASREDMAIHLNYLMLEVEQIREHITGQLGPLLGISLGFNALDGD